MMIALSAEPLEIDSVRQAVRAQQFGAVVVFEGVVRAAGERGARVRELYYEAYPELALAEMNRIVNEINARWGACVASIQHRIGTVAVGELSVAVAVGSEHRADAFEACAYAIEQIKRRAAIWKQERYTDGTARWLDGISGAGS